MIRKSLRSVIKIIEDDIFIQTDAHIYFGSFQKDQLKQRPGKQAVSALEFLHRTVLGKGNWLRVRQNLFWSCICITGAFSYSDCMIIAIISSFVPPLSVSPSSSFQVNYKKSSETTKSEQIWYIMWSEGWFSLYQKLVKHWEFPNNIIYKLTCFMLALDLCVLTLRFTPNLTGNLISAWDSPPSASMM